MANSSRRLLSLVMFGGVIFSGSNVKAQLASYDVVPATASPQAGESVEIRIRALTVLGVSIPLFLPTADINVLFEQAGVTLESISGGFPFADEGDGLFVIDADGVHVFDALGGITMTVRRELAGPVDLSVASGLVQGAAAMVWQAAASHHLAFVTQPVDGSVDDSIEVSVELVDEFGNRVGDDQRMVTLVVVGSADILVGVTTKATEDGIAVWDETDNLKITEAGEDFRMMAIATGGTLIETGAELTIPFARNALSSGNTNSNSNSNNNDNSGTNGNDNSNPNTNGNNNSNGNDNQNMSGDDDDDDEDRDDDGIPDDLDENPDDPDTNMNGIPDGDETDHDDDGIVDSMDSSPNDPDRDNDGHKDGADNCPDHANADQADEDDNGIGDYCEDDDEDGVINGFEDEGPNGGDANNDGTSDREQPHVAAVTIDGEHMITLVAPTGTALSDVAAMDSISPSDKPIVPFPLGLLKFSVVNLPSDGASITVRGIMNVAAANQVNSFFAFGPTPGDQTPHWYEFDFDGSTGVTVSGEVMSLQFTDGGRGDDDLKTDGRLSIRGGPAQVIDVMPMGCGAGCGAGMTLSFFPCLLATRIRRLWLRPARK